MLEGVIGVEEMFGQIKRRKKKNVGGKKIGSTRRIPKLSGGEGSAIQAWKCVG